jgi:hypothetical protein
MKPSQHLAGLVENFFGKIVDFFADHPRVVVVLLFVIFVMIGVVGKHSDLFVDWFVSIVGWN